MHWTLNFKFELPLLLAAWKEDTLKINEEEIGDSNLGKYKQICVKLARGKNTPRMRLPGASLSVRPEG